MSVRGLSPAESHPPTRTRSAHKVYETRTPAHRVRLLLPNDDALYRPHVFLEELLCDIAGTHVRAIHLRSRVRRQVRPRSDNTNLRTR